MCLIFTSSSLPSCLRWFVVSSFVAQDEAAAVRVLLNNVVAFTRGSITYHIWSAADSNDRE